MYSRRDFGRISLAALSTAALSAGIDSTIRGVTIGVQTYSFRDMPLDPAIDAMKTIGLGECELFMGHVEPAVNAAKLRDWRLSVSMDHFHAIRQKLDQAGVSLLAYTFNFRESMSAEELDRAFVMTKALGVDLITTSTTLKCMPRLVPLAERYKVRVAMHGHDKFEDVNEFSSPESFAAALAMSPNFCINLDIGHFTAANYDAVSYIEQHHDKIVALHIKDRKRNHGANLPFGEGETPIKAVLQLLRDKHYAIPANIEYEYGRKGMDTVAEVKKSFEFMKSALA